MPAPNSVLVFTLTDKEDVSFAEELLEEYGENAYVIVSNSSALSLTDKLSRADIIRSRNFSSKHDLLMFAWLKLFNQFDDPISFKILHYPDFLEPQDIQTYAQEITTLLRLLYVISNSVILEHGLTERVKALSREVDVLESDYWRGKLRKFTAECESLVIAFHEVSLGVSISVSESSSLSPTFFTTKLRNFTAGINKDSSLIEGKLRSQLNLFEKQIKILANETDKALRGIRDSEPGIYLLYSSVLAAPRSGMQAGQESLNIIYLARQIELLSTYIAIKNSVVNYNPDRREFRFVDDDTRVSGVGRLITKLRNNDFITSNDEKSLREIISLRNNLLETHGFGRLNDDLSNLKNSDVYSIFKSQVNNKLYTELKKDIESLSLSGLLIKFSQSV